MDDRAADRSPKLILMVGSNFSYRIEEVARVQIGVAQKFECVSMEAVCPRLGNDVDLPTAVVAILGVIVVGQNTKLRDGIKVGNCRCAAIAPFLHHRSIQEKSVVRFPLTVD